MTYDEATAALESLIDFEKLGATYFGRDRFQLANVRRLLQALGDPQTSFRIAHIAGTKGKGSTAAMAAAILEAHGLTTGLFTQPHLRDIRERTQVSGEKISRQAFADITAALLPMIEAINADPGLEPITFYEAHLALTLQHFAAAGVEVAVIETGLGGRLDATNALQPDVCAITRIDYDHTDLLGETLPEIAGEKAGIIKHGVPCVFAPQAPEVTEVLVAAAHVVGAPRIALPRIADGADNRFAIHASEDYPDLSLPLLGDHQRENAAVAVALVEALAQGHFDLSAESARRALGTLRWPGRFQIIDGAPTIVLDVAHNTLSARVLRDELAQFPPLTGGGRLILVVGMAKDKDIDGFAQTLFPLAHHVFAARAVSGRAVDAEAIHAPAAKLGLPATLAVSVAAALDAAREAAEPSDVVCVTGSFHVVGEAMEALDLEA